MPFDRTAEDAAAAELKAAAGRRQERRADGPDPQGRHRPAASPCCCWSSGSGPPPQQGAQARPRRTSSSSCARTQASRAAAPAAGRPRGVAGHHGAAALPSATPSDEMRDELAALVERQPEDVAALLRGWLVERPDDAPTIASDGRPQGRHPADPARQGAGRAGPRPPQRDRGRGWSPPRSPGSRRSAPTRPTTVLSRVPRPARPRAPTSPRAAWPSPSSCSSSRSAPTARREIIERLNAAAVQMPFQFLHRADPAQLRSFIADEHPQIIALVLAHMTADKASLLLSGLPPEQQAEVAHRIAVMDRTSPEIIRSVEATLERKLSSVLQPAEMSRVGGVDPLVNIINRSDRSTERQIVEGLESLDAALAEEVRSRMFMFEDIVQLDDRVGAAGAAPGRRPPSLALALKGVSEQVRDKITSQPVRARRREPARGDRAARRRSASPRSRRPSRASSAPSASSRSRARSWSAEGATMSSSPEATAWSAGRRRARRPAWPRPSCAPATGPGWAAPACSATPPPSRPWPRSPSAPAPPPSAQGYAVGWAQGRREADETARLAAEQTDAARRRRRGPPRGRAPRPPSPRSRQAAAAPRRDPDRAVATQVAEQALRPRRSS